MHSSSLRPQAAPPAWCDRQPASRARPPRFQAARRAPLACRSSLARPEADFASRVWSDYCRLQRPARHNIVFSKALKAFTTTAVLAYECGCSEGALREQISGSRPPGEAVLAEADLEDCILALGLVWLTLGQLPASCSRRWARGQAVSEQTQQRWSGFVAMILRGYLERRWAYHPIDRLSLEVTLATGRTEPPSTVAEWSRLVYAALEHAAPQWPAED